jgi:hypothetical protein
MVDFLLIVRISKVKFHLTFKLPMRHNTLLHYVFTLVFLQNHGPQAVVFLTLKRLIPLTLAYAITLLTLPCLKQTVMQIVCVLTTRGVHMINVNITIILYQLRFRYW